MLGGEYNLKTRQFFIKNGFLLLKVVYVDCVTHYCGAVKPRHNLDKKGMRSKPATRLNHFSFECDTESKTKSFFTIS